MCGHATVPIMSGKGQMSGFVVLNEKLSHHIAMTAGEWKEGSVW